MSEQPGTLGEIIDRYSHLIEDGLGDLRRLMVERGRTDFQSPVLTSPEYDREVWDFGLHGWDRPDNPDEIERVRVTSETDPLLAEYRASIARRASFITSKLLTK